MDQELGWWVRIALDGWRQRAGPHYRRIAVAMAEAMEQRLADQRLPAERPLADALGVSRGTVVRAYQDLVDARLVERRQGAGTFVRPRLAWTHTPLENPASALLRRRLAQDGSIDLSLAVPAGVDHLPPTGPLSLESSVDDQFGGLGHGLNPAGTPALREAIALHLTAHLGLPTSTDQLIVTSGAQHALSLVLAALHAPGRTVITGCPTYPGLLAAAADHLVGVSVDALGLDVHAVRQAAARVPAPVVYVDSAAHNPTGAVLDPARRAALLAIAPRHDAVLVEDLAQAGLGFEGSTVPLAATDDSVIAIGSLSKMFWAGLRIGWIRAPAALRGYLLRLRSASDLAPSVPSQLIATRLLHAGDTAWQHGLRTALRDRRDLLLDLLRRHLPAWQPQPPQAGLSLWAKLPVTDSETFAHLAAGYGVLVAPGATACVDGKHRNGIRLSFAQPAATLESAVDRLTAAWEEHTRQLAASR